MLLPNELVPTHAVCSMQPVSTRKINPVVRSFLRFDFLIPAPQTNNPGITRASASFVKPLSFCNAATGPVVRTVSVEEPMPAFIEIKPGEQVTAALTCGVTLQLKFNVEEMNPPVGVMVIVDRVEPPGATEAGDSADDERLKPEFVTTTFAPLDVLPLKLLSPPYTAVMMCVPAVRVDVENVATRASVETRAANLGRSIQEGHRPGWARRKSQA